MKKLISFCLLTIILSITVFAQSTISKGSKVKILELNKDDSYFDERNDFIGKDAKVVSELSKNSNGFYTGTLETSSGRTCYFTNVKVAVSSSSSSSSSSSYSTPSKSTSSSSLFNGTIPKGTNFKVIEVPESDAYYQDRKEIEGETGVTTEALTQDEDGYVGGSLKLSNGNSYYFYKVRIGKTSNNSSSSKVSNTDNNSTYGSSTPTFIKGTIKKGTKVYVADISKADSYYSNRDQYIGKRGTPNENDMIMRDDEYYSGSFKYDDGSTSYFYKAKFSLKPISDNTSNVSNTNNTDDNPDLSHIQKGTKVIVIDVSPDDSYYSKRNNYIRKKGKVTGSLDLKSDGFYSGNIDFDDGTAAFFYRVKVRILE